MSSYITTVVDDYSRYVMSYIIKQRSEAPVILKQFAKDVAHIRGVVGFSGGASFKPTVKILQSYCPGEFTSKEFETSVQQILGASHVFSSDANMRIRQWLR
jgi:hypothetical protein